MNLGHGHPHYALDYHGVHFGFIEAPAGEALKRGMAGAIQFGFRVNARESVDEIYRRAVAGGAKSIIEPDDMPWGRRAMIGDPDGRPLQLIGIRDLAQPARRFDEP